MCQLSLVDDSLLTAIDITGKKPAMKLWEEYTLRITRSEVLDELVRFYETQKIPIEIRHHCCTLIDDQLFDPMAARDFVSELETGFKTLPNFDRHRLSWFKKLLVTEYKNDPDLLINKFHECLNKEFDLVNMESGRCVKTPSDEGEQAFEPEDSVLPKPVLIPAVRRNNSDILSFKRAIENFRKFLQTKKEEFDQLHFLGQNAENLTLAEQAKQLDLEHNAADCGAPKYQLFHKLYFLVEKLKALELLEGLENDLRDWEYELKRSYIGFPMTRALQDSKNSATDLYSILSDVTFALRDLESMQSLNLVDVYPSDGHYNCLDQQLGELKERLLKITCRFEPTKSTLRFDSQKPILHYGAKFPLKVSCFAAIDNSIKVRKVAVEILTEEEAAGVAKNPFDPKKPPKTNPIVGILSNNMYPIDAPVGRKVPKARRTESNISITQGSYLNVDFPHFTLTRAADTSRRHGNKQSEAVTDKRYYLFVYFTLEVDGKECHIWRTSTPITIGSHGTQDGAAWGNLLWSYGLSTLDEPINSGVMKMKAEWNDILELLNAFHTKIAGQPLGTMQRAHLTSRAKRNGKQLQSYSDMFKDEMDGNPFTFWGWFFNSLNLAKFLPITTAHNVNGFISKQDAKNLLNKKKRGTFVIRYSDSMLGGLSIVCKPLAGTGMNHLTPKSKEDLEKECIEAIIQNSQDHLFLYPNIPKAAIQFKEKPEKQNKNSTPPWYTKLQKFYRIDSDDIFSSLDLFATDDKCTNEDIMLEANLQSNNTTPQWYCTAQDFNQIESDNNCTSLESPMTCESEMYEIPPQVSPITIPFDHFNNTTMDTFLLTPPNSEPENVPYDSSGSLEAFDFNAFEDLITCHSTLSTVNKV